MAVLPTVGASKDTWGTELNEWLRVEHGADGTHGNISGPVINVKEATYGAVGDGVADDTTAIESAMAAGQHIYFPAGTYLTTGITGFTHSMILEGDGPNRSIIKSSDGTTVFEIASLYLNQLQIKNLDIRGTGSGSGHGIHAHTHACFMLFFENLRIADHGGKGLYLEQGFSSTLKGIDVDNCGDNAIEILGGNTLKLENCYVHDVAEDKAAYRIYGSYPVLINCNGIDSSTNADWGVFGRTVAEDGVVSYCHVTLIGCNIENFTNRGIRFKTNSYGNFFSTSIQAPASGTVTALSYEYCEGTYMGIWDGLSSITTAGAAWADGYAVHSHAMPFIQLGRRMVSGFYDDDLTTAFTIPALITDYTKYLKYFMYMNSLAVDELSVLGANRQMTDVKQKTTEKTGLSGATVTWTNAIPAGSQAIGVTARVTTLVEGCTTINIGDGTDADIFVDGMAVAEDTTADLADCNDGTLLPTTYKAATNIVLTAVGDGASFSAGAIRLTLHYIELTPPTS